MSENRSSSSVIRLLQDLREIATNPTEGISASPIDENNMFIWTAMIIGPDATPWEGGMYQLRLVFSESYPEKPPRIRFVSEMFHPNVFQDGSLCLDIVQQNWSPVYSVSSILLSIRSLLSDPNPNSPANSEAARLFVSDSKTYNRRVRRIAQKSVDNVS